MGPAGCDTLQPNGGRDGHARVRRPAYGIRRHDRDSALAAYDDRRGVTAAFDRNVLRRLNREFRAAFDLTAFRHLGVWNDRASRVEMHLDSRATQTVQLAGEQFVVEEGETIWTESSYKYDHSRLDRLPTEGGCRVCRLWMEEAARFWVALIAVT